MAGNYYMGMAGQRSYSTPNPVNFNYPKLMHMKGNQYSSYPKFKEKEEPMKESQDSAKSANLAKELEKEIKELQKLTKEAKDLAKKKLSEEKEKSKNRSDDASAEGSSNKNNAHKSTSIKRLRRSNLDKVS